MLYYLFNFLDQLDFPGAGMFKYVSFRSGLALLLSLFISTAIGRRIINRLQMLQIGETVRNLGLEGQMSKKGTPTMGGIIIIIAILVPTILCAKLNNIYLLLMIVIGGVGSVHGAFLGAIFLITLPELITIVKDYLPAAVGQAPGLKALVYGVVLVSFVLFEPMGLYGRWLKIRTYLQMFPFYRKGMFKRQKSFQKSDRLK